MTLPINYVTWSAAALPIIVLLLLMLRWGWGAAEAAPLGVLTAIVVSLTVYGASPALIALESAKGIWNALTVLFVIWPAILIYEVTYEAGAFDVFRKGMQRLTPNELLQILAIGWVFVSFLMGITGFGVPVAVGAPLLVGIGVQPVFAVVLALLGHAWGNTFGTLSVAWQALVMQTGLEGSTLYWSTALWTASFLFFFNYLSGVAICYFYGKGRAVKMGLPAVTIISLIHGGGQLVLSQVNPTIACFLSTVVALGAVFLIGRMKRYREPWRIEESKIMARDRLGSQEEAEQIMDIHEAFVPYYALTFITLFILLIPSIKHTLGQVEIGMSFPSTMTSYGVVNRAEALYSSFRPFVHAGSFLLAAALIGFWYFRSKHYILRGGGKAIVLRSIEKTVPSTIAVVGLIVMSKIMGGTGQTSVLATGTASFTGGLYALIAPAIGLLGAFMTSSNMASNILFGEFQLMTAEFLSLDPATILGAQTAGGAIGNTIAPGNVILGTTTAGILGLEGKVLKRILPIALASAFVVGGIVFFVTVVL